MIKLDVNGQKIEATATPIKIFVKGEPSQEIVKFYTKEKEYVVQITPTGGLYMK